MHVPTGLDMGFALDHLDRQTALTDELSRRLQVHGPQTETVLLVRLHIALDPIPRIVAGETLRVEAHGLAIADDRGERIGVLQRLLAKYEPRSRRDLSYRTLP